MKISLITVCYNAAKTIGDAMASVAEQRVGLFDCSDCSDCSIAGGLEIEYIVVDGGSTDGTVDIIKKFATQFDSIEQSNTTLATLLRKATFGRWISPNNRTISFRWLSEKDRGMYDALNKGIRMATGDVIGILNADDVLAEDDTLVRIARLFDCSEISTDRRSLCEAKSLEWCSIDGCYGDIRFVRDSLEGLERLRKLPTIRYCSGKWFRPWMFRFGTQTAHPSTFFRKECFVKWGDYSLDYGMYGDFELLCRFIWKNKARMKYLPICTTVMRMGGASTNGWRTTLKINRSDLRALKANGCWSCLPFLYLRYLAKIWGFVFRGL